MKKYILIIIIILFPTIFFGQNKVYLKTKLIDTTSLSNRILQKINITDSALMLAGYQTAINARVKVADTATMLLGYQTAINARLKVADTATMLSGYQTAIKNSYYTVQSSVDSNSFIIKKPNGLQDTIVIESVTANSFSLPYKSLIAKIEMDGTRVPIITIYTNNTGKTVSSITSPADKVIKIVFSADMSTGIFNWTIPAYPGNSNWLGAINFDSMNDLRFEGSVSNNFVCFLDIKFF